MNDDRGLAWVFGPLVAVLGFALLVYRGPVTDWYRRMFRSWYSGTRMEAQADRIRPWWAVVGGVFCLVWATVLIVVVGILNIPI